MMDDNNEPTEVEAEAPQADPEHVAPESAGGPATLTLKRNGAETDIVFALNPPAIVGRFDPAVGPIDVDLGSMPEGSYVSRKHAKIDCEDGVWSVHDLGSSNGTFVLRSDFERVEEAEIVDGDEVAFGNARFVFHAANGSVVEAAPVEAEEQPAAPEAAEHEPAV